VDQRSKRLGFGVVKNLRIGAVMVAETQGEFLVRKPAPDYMIQVQEHGLVYL